MIIFKKKRRKGYQRWRGFRAQLTVVRIGEIGTNAAHDTALAGALSEDPPGG